MPDWMTAIITASGWATFFIKLYMDRARVAFSLDWSWVGVDPATFEEEHGPDQDGDPGVHALKVVITNRGVKPLTFERVVCRYMVLSKANNYFERESVYTFKGEPTAQGAAGYGFPKLSLRTSQILSVDAFDSTGKQWRVGKRTLKAFNELALQSDWLVSN
jgi:hypothetical protein